MMAIHAYNTMSRQVEPLAPISPGKVGIYVCGPTVYDGPAFGPCALRGGFRCDRPLSKSERACRHLCPATLPTSTTRSSKKPANAIRDFKVLGRYYAIDTTKPCGC